MALGSPREGTTRMTLKEWISRSNLSYADFAKLVPCSETLPWMWSNGKANPSFRMAKRVARLTGDAVPVTNWFPPDDESPDEGQDISITDMMKGVKK